MIKALRSNFWIIVVGGAAAGVEKDCLNSIEISQNARPFKLYQNALKEKRRSPSIFPNKDKVLVVGGCEKQGSHLKSMEEIDVNGESKVVVGEISEGSSCSAFCQLEDGSNLIIGGFNGQCLNTVTQITNNPPKPLKPIMSELKNSVAIPYNEKLLLLGGWDGKRTLDTIFSYCVNENISYEGRLPYPIEGHSAVKHGDNIIITGGYDGISVVSNITVYNLKDRKCKVIEEKLEISRENHSSVIFEVDGKTILLVVGGWNGKEALKQSEAFEVTDSDPFLKRIEWDLHLNVARNRPAAIVIHQDE